METEKLKNIFQHLLSTIVMSLQNQTNNLRLPYGTISTYFYLQPCIFYWSCQARNIFESQLIPIGILIKAINNEVGNLAVYVDRQLTG